MRAENLGDTPLFTQPLLLAVGNLCQRISTTTDTVRCLPRPTLSTAVFILP